VKRNKMRFSFVIPALNEEKLIGNCIDSIKPQLSKEDEIIVVDNGSEDKTALIAKKLGCRVVKEKEKGISPARNKGASEAKGDIICFVDADGILTETWLKRAKEHFSKGRCDVIGGMVVFDNKSHVKKLWYNTYTALAYLGLFLSKLLLSRPFVSGNNMVIKKSVFKKVGGFEHVAGEDIWFSKGLWKLKVEVAFDPRMIIYYSSRGFDEAGFLRTIAFWVITTLVRKSSKDYDYRHKWY
jgi:glycosyltransferase involved in cell wall biosynthesis